MTKIYMKPPHILSTYAVYFTLNGDKLQIRKYSVGAIMTDEGLANMISLDLNGYEEVTPAEFAVAVHVRCTGEQVGSFMEICKKEFGEPCV